MYVTKNNQFCLNLPYDHQNADELVLYEDGPLVVTSQNALRAMSDVLKFFLMNTCSIEYAKELNEFTGVPSIYRQQLRLHVLIFSGSVIVSVDELSSNSFLENVSYSLWAFSLTLIYPI